MDLFDRIKLLCKQRGISISKLEEKLSFPRGYLYTLKKKVPGVDRLKSIADFFDVSTDYLLGRTPTPTFTAKDEIDVQKAVTDLIQGLSNKDSLAFLKNNGEELDEEDAELLRSSLENVARQSLLLSKKRAQENNKK